MHIPSNFVQVYNAFSLRYKRIEKFHNANLFEDWKYAKRGGVSYNVPLDALFFAFGIYHSKSFGSSMYSYLASKPIDTNSRPKVALASGSKIEQSN